MSVSPLMTKEIPCSEQLERFVLGSILLESTAINEVADLLRPEIFYSEPHRKIYSVIEEIFREGKKIDMLVVTEKLMKAGTLEEAGGMFYISDLTTNVVSTVNLLNHSRHLCDLWIGRELYFTSLELAKRSVDQFYDVSDTLAYTIQRIEAISQQTEYGSNLEHISSFALRCVHNYEERKENAGKGLCMGVTTGLQSLDKLTSGWLAGQLIILAARPAMGKTALMLHFALSAARSGKHVLIFSLEMNGESLTDRFILSLSGADADRYKSGKLTPEEEKKVSKAVDDLHNLPITIDKTANINVHQIKARARNQQAKKKCDIILIDYLQLIDMRNENRSYNREQEISQTSRATKLMAKDLSVPVVMLAQLSRKPEERANKTPLLSDLRESGAIEQDADMVCFIHRPEYYDKQAEKGREHLIMAKQREGRTGQIDFSYNDNLTRIKDYEKPF